MGRKGGGRKGGIRSRVGGRRTNIHSHPRHLHQHHGLHHISHFHHHHHNHNRRRHISRPRFTFETFDPLPILGNGISNNTSTTLEPAIYAKLMFLALTLSAHGMGNYSSLTDEEKTSNESELKRKLETRILESSKYRESISSSGRLLDENGFVCDKILVHQTYVKKEDEMMAKAIGDGRLIFLKDYQKEVQNFFPSTTVNPLPLRKIQLCNEKWEDCQVANRWLDQFRLPSYMKGIQGKCLTCNTCFTFGTGDVKGHVIYFEDHDLHPAGNRVITGVLVRGEISSPDNNEITIEGNSFALLETEGFVHHETTPPNLCCGCYVQ